MKTQLFIILIILILTGCSGNSSKQDNKQVKAEILSAEFIADTTQYAQCHASTILETRNGLLLAFFGGTHERNPDVCIYIAAFRNGKWEAPVKVADGKENETLLYPTWNPVLFRGNDERISLFYKVGPSPNDWWGMVMHSDDEGQTWSSPEKLPVGILGPIRNKPLHLKSGVILSPSSTEVTHELWKSNIERSADGGQSWEKIVIPSPDSIKVIQPTLLLYPDNSIQALLRSNQNVIMESWSTDEGKTWSKVAPTTILHPNSGIDAITLHSGEKLLVNNPIESGKSWEAGRNKLDLYHSNDGINWTDIFKLEDHPKGEFSYPAIIQTKDGRIHITYTHNRTKIKHLTLELASW
ncbi:exo-alpha-sialidase [Prolixibacteraceae bacterium Z1-6]|uniref:Exo-alpha-sialidase n=1 Tax=Draconibacterium aestuarii TaxID=2998507 RepID=A0A9X3F7D6_9BACT|nr:exo-alpha-sialidase [Prolixibacteraceae bacterium Z1-6]